MKLDDPLSWQVTIILILLVLSGIISSSETALTALSNAKLEELIAAKKGGKGLKLWRDNPSLFLTSLLILNNVINISISVLTTVIAERIFSENSVGIAIGVATFLILSFGEVIPKTIALTFPDRVSVLFIRVISIFLYISYPIAYLLTEVSALISSLFGKEMQKRNLYLTEKEIETMVALSSKKGLFKGTKGRMIHSIFDFTDTTVNEIMIHRTDMVTVRTDEKLEDILEKITQAGHSRIPVYENTIDNIVGILYSKDLLNFLAHNDKNEFSIKKLLRKPYFTPESKKISELLKEFQKKRVHMAIVVDEFGGTAGLITLEDILEELVGDIKDEFDDTETPIKRIGKNRFLVDGKLPIKDLEHFLNLEFPDSIDSESVGGLLVSEKGRVPAAGESIVCNGLKFRVLEANEKRVIKVEIERLPRIIQEQGS